MNFSSFERGVLSLVANLEDVFDMAKKLTTGLVFKYIPLYLRGFYEYHVKKHFGTLIPRELMFPVTYRCNARCVMCDIWKYPRRKELSLQQIEQLLSDELFRGVQVIDITGGEPTLREDLVQVVHVLIDKLPKLKKIGLSTNALDTDRVIKSCVGIAEAAKNNGIDFFVAASLDGIGRTHESVRGVPDAFRRVSKTIFRIKQLSRRHHFRFGVGTTISPINLRDIANVHKWCKLNDIDVDFTLASVAENYYANVGEEEHLRIKDEDEKYLIEFLQKLAREKSLLNFSAYYYYDLIRMMRNDQQRTTPCPFALDAFILDAYGDMYYCMYGEKIGNCLRRNCSYIYFDPRSLAHRNEIIRNKCPRCFIDCFISMGMGKELIKYIGFLFSRS